MVGNRFSCSKLRLSHHASPLRSFSRIRSHSDDLLGILPLPAMYDPLEQQTFTQCMSHQCSPPSNDSLTLRLVSGTKCIPAGTSFPPIGHQLTCAVRSSSPSRSHHMVFGFEHDHDRRMGNRATPHPLAASSHSRRLSRWPRRQQNPD